MAEPAVLEVAAVSRVFDVSRPWLQRTLAGRGPPRAACGRRRVVLHRPRHHAFPCRRKRLRQVTVARLAVGRYRPSAGDILFEGRDLSSARADAGLRRRMNMIFQDPYASLNPRWRVRGHRLRADPRLRLLKTGAEITARVGQLLTQVGLSPVGRREVSARILRRPAPAHFHRPRAVQRA